MDATTQKPGKITVEIAGTDLEFRTVPINDESPSGAQLAHLAGFSPKDYAYVLHLRDDGQLEDVRTVESILLSDGRRFIVAEADRSFRIAMDGTPFDWPGRFITAATLRKLGGVPSDKVIYLEKVGDPDQLLSEDDIVDLAEPGVESFRQGHDRPKEQTVHVRHLGELETAKFKIAETSTLQAIWDRAYKELDLTRQPRDVFQAEVDGNAVDLMNHLSISLIEAQSKNLCKKKFEIAARTGGA